MFISKKENKVEVYSQMLMTKTQMHIDFSIITCTNNKYSQHVEENNIHITIIILTLNNNSQSL